MTKRDQLYEIFELEVKEDYRSLRELASALNDNALRGEIYSLHFKEEALVVFEDEDFIDDETAQMLLDYGVRLDEFYYHRSNRYVNGIDESIADSIRAKVSEIKSEIQEFLNQENLNQESLSQENLSQKSLNQESLNQEGGQDNMRESVQDYKIIKTELFISEVGGDDWGHAIGFDPDAENPYVVLRFQENSNGDRRYHQEQYVNSHEEAKQVFNKRLDDDRTLAVSDGFRDLRNKATDTSREMIIHEDDHNFYVLDAKWLSAKNERIGHYVLAGPLESLSQAVDFIDNNNGILVRDWAKEEPLQYTENSNLETNNSLKLYRTQYWFPNEGFDYTGVFAAQNDDEAIMKSNKELAEMRNTLNARGGDGNIIEIIQLEEVDNKTYDTARTFLPGDHSELKPLADETTKQDDVVHEDVEITTKETKSQKVERLTTELRDALFLNFKNETSGIREQISYDTRKQEIYTNTHVGDSWSEYNDPAVICVKEFMDENELFGEEMELSTNDDINDERNLKEFTFFAKRVVEKLLDIPIQDKDYAQTAADNATMIIYLRNEKGIDSDLLIRLSSEGKIEHLYGHSKPLVLKGDEASNVVLVFDKNLDLLSFETQDKVTTLDGDKFTLKSAFEKDHKIALRASQDTPFFEPLKKFLEDNPNIDGIIPCFAEKVGFDGVMNTLKSEFGNDYAIASNIPPRGGGSWNDALMEYHKANQLTDEQEEGFDMDYDDD